MPCRRHVINRSTLKKIDLLITTIFIFENSPGCQSENREGYTRNIQNVYFILSELSIHLKNITDKSSFWLRHVISFIQWSDNASVELILERMHKKKSNVEKEISEKVLNLIQVDYEKFKNN